MRCTWSILLCSCRKGSARTVQGLQNAEGYLRGEQGKKSIGTVAREAAQMAEDARIITVKKD